MSSSSKNKIKGALAASLTAFKKDLSLDIKLTIKHGQDLLDQGLDGVVFFGTTGEGNSINIQEKKQFIDALVNEKFENEREENILLLVYEWYRREKFFFSPRSIFCTLKF